ncbi:MAG: TIM barrel protein [Chloroflexi bacterium]|nr:TIM barrel protein [Chloroflexota bacterium]
MIKIGCGQITWRGVPESQVLDDIARAGYAGSPPRLNIDRSAADTVSFYQQYGLEPAPCYFSAPFWRADQCDNIVEAANRAARFVRDIGCTEMYVAAAGDYTARNGRSRRDASGHVKPDDSLTDDEWRTFADTLNAVAAASLREGVSACFHNHVGTVIEVEDEVERLLEMTDPEMVFLGPDTGHLAWAGVDVLDFCRRYLGRIKTMHLKDIDGSVRARGADAQWSYTEFVDDGIFVELGEGCVDFRSIMSMLAMLGGFTGWLIVETDVTQKPSAFESARVSRAYLHGLGV